jgi:Phosphoribosyl transferase domain
VVKDQIFLVRVRDDRQLKMVSEESDQVTHAGGISDPSVPLPEIAGNKRLRLILRRSPLKQPGQECVSDLLHREFAVVGRAALVELGGLGRPRIEEGRVADPGAESACQRMGPVIALLCAARGILNHGAKEVNQHMRGLRLDHLRIMPATRSSQRAGEGQNAWVSDIIGSTTMPEPTIGDMLLSENQIHDRLADLAAEIDSDYAGRDLVVLGVLKGAMMVMADLARLLRHDRVEIDWIAVSSYGNNTSSSGVIRVLKEPDLTSPWLVVTFWWLTTSPTPG